MDAAVELSLRCRPSWAKAEAYCQRHFGNSIADLGWEDYITSAIAGREDVELVCASLGRDFDVDDLTHSIWQPQARPALQ